jgi:hypothetical protein
VAAGQGASTGWAASLITLPMLPPIEGEFESDTCVDEAYTEAAHDTDVDAATGEADCLFLTPLHPGVSFNVTPADGTSDKPRQPLWLTPVM